MGRGLSTFKKADLTRAAIVAREQGFEVEVTRSGTIRLVLPVDLAKGSLTFDAESRAWDAALE